MRKLPAEPKRNYYERPFPIEVTDHQHEKSTFFVEMLEHRNRQKYITIEQIVHINNSNHHSEKIRINPIALEDIIEALLEMRDELTTSNLNGHLLTDNQQQEIVKRYLKGLEVKDLAVQFNCSERAVISVLLKHKVEVVEQGVPKFVGRKWKSGRVK